MRPLELKVVTLFEAARSVLPPLPTRRRPPVFSTASRTVPMILPTPPRDGFALSREASKFNRVCVSFISPADRTLFSSSTRFGSSSASPSPARYAEPWSASLSIS